MLGISFTDLTWSFGALKGKSITWFVIMWTLNDTFSPLLSPSVFTIKAYYKHTHLQDHAEIQKEYVQIVVVVVVVHIMQVKVVLRWRLKLIVMISLSFHAMESQRLICVPCVTKYFLPEKVWVFTKERTVKKTGTRVVSVRNVFHILIAWAYIWMFIAVNTSALNVESVLEAVMH